MADLTGSLFGKKFSTHLVPLIKVEGLFVEGLFAPYIVSIFDIVKLLSDDFYSYVRAYDHM